MSHAISYCEFLALMDQQQLDDEEAMRKENAPFARKKRLAQMLRKGDSEQKTR